VTDELGTGQPRDDDARRATAVSAMGGVAAKRRERTRAAEAVMRRGVPRSAWRLRSSGPSPTADVKPARRVLP
jgi:hypothetical protein